MLKQPQLAGSRQQLLIVRCVVEVQRTTVLPLPHDLPLPTCEPPPPPAIKFALQQQAFPLSRPCCQGDMHSLKHAMLTHMLHPPPRSKHKCKEAALVVHDHPLVAMLSVPLYTCSPNFSPLAVCLVSGEHMTQHVHAESGELESIFRTVAVFW